MKYKQKYPLHAAIAECDVISVNSLIENGVNVNEKDKRNLDPLSKLLTSNYIPDFLWDSDVKKKCIDIARVLLEAGAKPLGTHMLGVVMWGAVELVRLLLKYEVDDLDTSLNVSNEPFSHPLLATIHFKNHLMTRLLLFRIDPMVSNSEGNTLLSYAIEEMYFKNSPFLNDPVRESESLKYLFLHPSVNPNHAGMQKQIKNIIKFSTVYFVRVPTELSTQQEQSIKDKRIALLIAILTRAGIDLRQWDSNAVIDAIHGESSFQNKDESNSFYRLIKDTFYPFFKLTIESALQKRAEEQAPLDKRNIKDPQIVKQFLLASDEEKEKLLTQIEILKEQKGIVDPVTIQRFLLSSVKDRKAFLKIRNRLDKMREKPFSKDKEKLFEEKNAQHLYPLYRLLYQIKGLPAEVQSMILSYVLHDPNRPFLFIEDPVSADEQEDAELEAATASLSIR